MHIRTVDVEILREGPRHNQLLSPLTHYLAICNDAPADRIVLPDNYEHAAFERRMAELRYEVVSDDPGRRQGIIDETGTNIGAILGGIPGLPGALSADPSRNDELIHLRLVLSASELSLIPFELSKIPVGGGARPDGVLLLDQPVCLTRRTRSVVPDRRPWGENPQILFIGGPDVEDVFDEHLDALHEVLKPWSKCPTKRGPTDTSPPWLTVLRHATLADVEQAMKQRPTFVHILAHGAEDFDNPYGGFGVALEGETVSGRRLASALTTVDEHGDHRPTVVTLATCDSANEASPIPPDSSVAHALHSKGIALVVASQFPLSVDGSVPFVKIVYDDLLWGRHPLQSLRRLRIKLQSAQGSFHHDWAAIIAYEALPDDLGAQLDEMRYWQSRRAHESALRRVEGLRPPVAIEAASSHWVPPEPDEYRQVVEAAEVAAGELPAEGSYAVESVGLRAAGWKRLAEVDYWLAASGVSSDTGATFARVASRLTQSTDAYRVAVNSLLGGGGEVVNKKVSLHWMLTQVLASSLLLPSSDVIAVADGTSDGTRPFTEFEGSLWHMSKLAAEIDRNAQSGGSRAWGHVSLVELWLLRVGDDSLTAAERASAAEKALDNAKQIVAIVGKEAEQTVNTRRQIDRYVQWWGSPDFAANMSDHGVQVGESWRAAGGLIETAKKIVDALSGGQLASTLHPDRADDDTE